MRVKRAAALAAAAVAGIAVPATVHGGPGTGSSPHSASTGAVVAWADIENPFGDGRFYEVVVSQPTGTTVAGPGNVDLRRTWTVMSAATPGVPFNNYSCITLTNPGQAQLFANYPASGFVNVSCNDGMGFDFYRITWSQSSWWTQYNESIAGASDFDGHGTSVTVPLPDANSLSFGQVGSSGITGNLKWEHSKTDVLDVQMCGHSGTGWVCRNGIGEFIVTTDLTTSIVEN